MDKLMDTPWFLKILALLLAILLYSTVPKEGTKFTDVNVPGGQTTETLTNISVSVYYDIDNLVVSGIPNTVDITLKGPTTHVQSAKALRNFEVYVDLTKAKIGKQKVRLQVKGLSDKVKASITPATANVLVQEKITKEFNVEAEFNSNQIEEGYSAGQPVVEPNKVSITGPKSEIDRITYVKAALAEKEKLKESISQEARVQVLDKELNKLDLKVEPATVLVKIPIKSNTKTVPINIIQKGTTPEGVSIDSIELDTKDAVIMGQEDILKKTDNVRVEIDISKITDSTTLNLPIIISNGITKVTPQTVNATVVVTKQDQKTISGIPLEIQGLADNYQAQINDPENQMINLMINGPSAVLNDVKLHDFSAYIDLSSLVEGNHDVNIHVKGPAKVKWKPDKSKANITITRGNA